MSDVEYEYSEDEDNYYNLDVFNNDVDEDDDDGLRINEHCVEDLEDIKDYKRGIMIAERKVYDHVARLGYTVFKQKGYDSRTEGKCWTVCILLEEEENNNEATDEENNNEATAFHKLMDEIANYRNFLQVLERDMKEIKENCTGQMDAMKEDIKEKLKSFRENVCGAHSKNVSGADNDGAVDGGAGIISKNNKECLQDIAAMGKKISPLMSTMEYELGI